MGSMMGQWGLAAIHLTQQSPHSRVSLAKNPSMNAFPLLLLGLLFFFLSFFSIFLIVLLFFSFLSFSFLGLFSFFPPLALPELCSEEVCLPESLSEKSLSELPFVNPHCPISVFDEKSPPAKQLFTMLASKPSRNSSSCLGLFANITTGWLSARAPQAAMPTSAVPKIAHVLFNSCMNSFTTSGDTIWVMKGTFSSVALRRRARPLFTLFSSGEPAVSGTLSSSFSELAALTKNAYLTNRKHCT